MSATFEAVHGEVAQQSLAELADEIWHEYWPSIIGAEQTDYMVEQFQSLDAIKRDMAEHNYEYWFVKAGDDGRVVGFTGGHNDEDGERFYISKIYVKKDERGKHFASDIIAFYTNLCRERGFKAMYLNVNKYNELGIRAYEGKGFVTIESVVNDIGSGFVMDDYVMQKDVSTNEKTA